MDKINDSTLQDGGECYPLYGQIEMLTVDSNYCYNSKMQYLAAQLNNVSCVTERDEFVRECKITNKVYGQKI